MAEERIRLMTRADDVGSFHSANKAAFEAHTNGILKNASLMVVCPYIEEAAEMLIGKTELCYGLHLTMNAEWETLKWGPVLGADKAPSLVDSNGHFFATTQEHHEHGAVFAEMLAECKAQLQRARDLGFEISYMETHMGFGWLFEGEDDSQRFGDELRKWAAEEGIIYDLPFLSRLPKLENPTGDRIADLAARYEQAQPGTYLVVGHTCFDDDEMRGHRLTGQEPLVEAKARDEQRRIFTDKRILDVVARRNIEPIRYSEAG
jgi:hypothetical protein